MAGITSTGFVSKRLPDVLDSLRNNARNRFGNTVNVQPDSVLGQLFDTLGAEITTLWQTLEATYASRDPAAAESVLLDILVYLNGITRKDKLNGTATLSLADIGFPSYTTIPQGTIITEPVTGKTYTTNNAVTASLSTCTFFALEAKNTYVMTIGDVWSVTINGNTSSYTILSGDTDVEARAGLAAAVNADTATTGWRAIDTLFLGFYSTGDVPTTVSASITGGNENYQFVATAVVCTETNFDTVTFPPLTLFNVSGGYANVVSAVNVADTLAGSDVESDTALRLRRQESLSYAGVSTLDSIVAKVRALPGVSATIGYENTTNTPDADGRPAKSFEIVVNGGINADIAQTIYDFKPAGIETTFGSNAISNVSVSIYDENLTGHAINFSKAYPIYLHLRIDYSTYDEERLLDSGANEIKRVAVEFATSGEYTIGKDVIPQRYFGGIYSNVAGIQEVSIQLDTTANSGDTATYITDTPIAVGIREYVVLIEDNVIVCRKMDNTVSVTSGSKNVTINAGDTAKLAVGDIVYFALQTDYYTIDAISGTAVKLTANYVGATNATQTMVVRRDY